MNIITCLPENQPYWFDIKGVVRDLWDEIIAVKNELVNTIRFLKESVSDPDAKRYTGVDLVMLVFLLEGLFLVLYYVLCFYNKFV